MLVRALEFGPDHVHLFVGNCKKYSVPQIAQYFKGVSSRELRKRYWEHVREPRNMVTLSGVMATFMNQ